MSKSEPKKNKSPQIVAGRDATVAGRDMTTTKSFNFLMPIFLIGTLAVLGGLMLGIINSSGDINQQTPELSQPIERE